MLSLSSLLYESRKEENYGQTPSGHGFVLASRANANVVSWAL
jgi:hypothetical protein